MPDTVLFAYGIRFIHLVFSPVSEVCSRRCLLQHLSRTLEKTSKIKDTCNLLSRGLSILSDEKANHILNQLADIL
jgi:heme exporter protein D